MAVIHASAVIAAPIEQVWDLVGDWPGISNWHPFVEKSELGDGPPAHTAGSTRICTLVNGAALTERQVERSDERFMYAYSITDGPMPMKSHKGVVQLHPVTDTGHTFVDWTITVEAEDEVLGTITAMFEEAIPLGLTALQTKLA